MNLINCEAGCSCWDKNHLGVTSKGAKYIILVEKNKENWIKMIKIMGRKSIFYMMTSMYGVAEVSTEVSMLIS